MTIEYDPNAGLLTQGQYDFYIRAASEKRTKNDHPMLMVAMEIYDNKNNKYEVRDYFMFVPQWMYKVRKFCESIGVNFESGKIDPEELSGKKGRAEIVQKYDEQFGAQNKVSKYLKMSTEQNTVDESFEDDDLPF
jgi:hypothetical protein